MSDLTIGRLTATVHGSEENRGRVDTLLRRVADHRLEANLSHEGLPDGEWCVRRVDLTVTLDDEADGILEGAWADAILASLRQSLTAGSSEVVVFADLHHTLVDLAVCVAAGDCGREWAWRLAGALQAGDPDPERDACGALMAACAHVPRSAVAALVRAVQATDIGTVERLVGVDGLTRLVDVISALHGVDCLVDRVGDVLAEDSAGTDSDRAGSYAGPQAMRSRRAHLDRARRLVGASVLARAVASSGLRITTVLAVRWAALAVAEADPSVLTGADAAGYVAAVAQLLVSHETGRGAGLGRPLVSTYAERAGGTAGAAPSRPQEPDEPARPSAMLGVASVQVTLEEAPPGAPQAVEAEARGPEIGQGAETDWGGLLFLLNTGAKAGLPERFGDPRLAARPLRWTLQQLARRLVPAAADDPAVLAFAGLGDRSPWPADDPASPGELAAVDDLALAWAAATARRLALARHSAVPEDPFGEVTATALRPAVIVGDAGWVEVRLSLDDVDLDIRRAGLDVDPGWIGWLGTVVRIRYG